MAPDSVVEGLNWNELGDQWVQGSRRRSICFFLGPDGMTETWLSLVGLI